MCCKVSAGKSIEQIRQLSTLAALLPPTTLFVPQILLKHRIADTVENVVASSFGHNHLILGH